MRKVLLTTALILSVSVAQEAQSAGLYLGAGYGRVDPKLSSTSVTKDSADYGLENSVAGWPERDDTSPDAGNFFGYQAAPWQAGLPETDTYKTKKGNQYSFAIGWKIPRNPFSFELEYNMMDFDSKGYNLNVLDPDGLMYAVIDTDCESYEGMKTQLNGGAACPTDGKQHWFADIDGVSEKPIPTMQYDFDINFVKPMETKINALMLNMYFEIPGLGPIDPYVGFGIGRAKTEYTFYDDLGMEFKGGSDGFVSAKQYMIGVDYRISGTPWIIGAEYRKFQSDFDERDDKIPYKSENKTVMFKVKYDFVSDKF